MLSRLKRMKQGSFKFVPTVLISNNDFNLNYISFSTTLVEGIIITVIAGAVNALLFGALVIIIALITGRSK